MTTNPMSQHPARARPTAAHVHRIPVVRELPSRPVENFDSRTW
jgi:hypothetical protein